MLLTYLLSVMAWVSGVCILQRLPDLPPAWLGFLVTCAAVCAAWRCARWRSSLLILSLFLAGFSYANIRAQYRLDDWLPQALEGQVIEAEGYVSDLPQATRFGHRFLFVPTHIVTANVLLPAQVQVSWYGDKQHVQSGERWRLVLKLKRPHGQASPGSFDLESWFLQQNIGATASVKSGQKLDGLASAAWLARIRSALRAKVNAALPDSPYAGVIVALSVGDQSAIPPEQWQRFAKSGITHLISISGLHITLLASLMAYLVSGIWRRIPFLASRLGAPRASLLAGLFSAASYSALAGMAVPTQRTLFMLATLVLCLWRAKPAASSAIWACALAVVTLIDPFAVLSVGFWLSFLTVGALLWAGSNRMALASKWRGWLIAQSAATIGSAPILLAVFGQLPLISPLANAFAIPVVSMLVTPLALAGLLDPTGAFLWSADRLFAGVDWLLMQCVALPGTQTSFTPAPLWTLAPAALGVVLFLAPRGFPGRLLGLVFVLPLFGLRTQPLADGAFRLSVLDVGQGLSVLVETRTSALLFDTGQMPNGERVVWPALRAAGHNHLDTLLLSHNDTDHVGSAEALLSLGSVGKMWHSLPDKLAWLEKYQTRERCVAGRQWRRDGVTFRLLWPPEGFTSKQDNAMSCVLLVDNGQFRVLLPADLGGAEEARLIGMGLPEVDVLIAGHHGGKGSSSAELISAIQPQYAVFSVGYRNHFGHPRPDTVQRFSDAGTKILRTDQSGALIFDIHENIALTPWRIAHKRYWYTPVQN